MRALIFLAVASGVAYLAVLGFLYVFQRSLLYVPDRSRPELGDLTGLGVREVGLTTSDGLRLLAWYAPPPAGRPVIAYFHGNGGNIGYRTNRLRRFVAAGFGVLMPEYRGYGGNPGSPSETGLFEDAAAALAFLRAGGVADRQLVLYGESLGSGIAVHMAAGRNLMAVVLESPYTSIAAAAQYHYPYVPAAYLIKDEYDSLSRIGDLKAPLLVLSGGSDRIVPPHLTRALFDAAPQPKEVFFVPDAGHVDLDAFGGTEATVRFLEKLLEAPGQEAGTGRRSVER